MLAPTSKLDAINTMLSTIGEAPINTLDDIGSVDAVMAEQVLDATSREVQGRGWHWNTEVEWPLSLSAEGYLWLPQSVLRADDSKGRLGHDVVVRGNRLYDRRKHTYVFSEGMTIDLMVLLDFEELPQPAKNFIMIRSARIFQERVVGSGTLSSFTEMDEIWAKFQLEEMEGDTAEYNILTDSYSVFRVLDR
jgi:hypothetical protein